MCDLDPGSFRAPEFGCVVEGGVYYERVGSFETDPWGDPTRTIGALIATKALGPVTDSCLESPGYNCLENGIDVTQTYKPAEPTGPGVPTRCVDEPGELYQSTWCPLVGPDVVHHRSEEAVDDSYTDELIGGVCFMRHHLCALLTEH